MGILSLRDGLLFSASCALVTVVCLLSRTLTCTHSMCAGRPCRLQQIRTISPPFPGFATGRVAYFFSSFPPTSFRYVLACGIGRLLDVLRRSRVLRCTLPHLAVPSIGQISGSVNGQNIQILGHMGHSQWKTAYLFSGPAQEVWAIHTRWWEPSTSFPLLLLDTHCTGTARAE